MRVIVDGMVMETLFEADKDSRGMVIGQKPYFRIYQKGEKSMIDIKKIPPEVAAKYSDGCKVAFSCKVFPWKTEDGTINIALSFADDLTERIHGTGVHKDYSVPMPEPEVTGDNKKK